ncbi:hypothetical protein [Fusibacter bizertensis]
MTYNIYDFIDRVLERPVLYVGFCSLGRISTLIGGFQIAMDELEVTDTSVPLFRDFNYWLGNKYGLMSAAGSYPNLILGKILGLKPHEIKLQEFDMRASDEQHQEAIAIFKNLLIEYRTLSQEEVDQCVKDFFQSNS